MDAQQQLFGLLALAEEHQKAVRGALEGLAEERAAMAQASATAIGAANEVHKAAAGIVPALQEAASEAVGASVRQSLAGASEVAVKALSEASRPVLDRLSSAASEAEANIKVARQWFAVAAVGQVGVCLVAYALLAWQLHQDASLREEKATLQADIKQMQANVAALKKEGGRIVLNTCGERLCIEASSNQGPGAEQWKGANWSGKENSVLLVIPNGY